MNAFQPFKIQEIIKRHLALLLFIDFQKRTLPQKRTVHRNPVNIFRLKFSKLASQYVKIFEKIFFCIFVPTQAQYPMLLYFVTITITLL